MPELAAWYHSRALRDNTRLRKLENIAAGATVFVLGNGPSLASQSPSVLEGSVTIACNRAIQWSKDIPDFTVKLATDAAALGYVESDNGCPTLVSPCQLTEQWCDAVTGHPHLMLLPASFTPSGIRCATPINHWGEWPTYAGWTVVITGISLAAWMGANRIVLLGVDMDYTHGSYFNGDEGVPTNGWDYERCSRNAFEAMASRLPLFNGNPGGKLDVVKRIKLEVPRRSGALPFLWRQDERRRKEFSHPIAAG
jgi:hypothetical protein